MAIISLSELIERDGNRCHYCGCETVLSGHNPTNLDAATRDHKISLARGGSNHASNIVLACLSCNRSKGHMRADTFELHLELEEAEERDY